MLTPKMIEKSGEQSNARELRVARFFFNGKVTRRNRVIGAVLRGSQSHMTLHDFPFAQTEQAKRFCDRIVEAMTIFCGFARMDSVRMVNEYWADVDDIEADPLFFHEPPYYYAMAIAHHPAIGDNRPDWYIDRSLWPPPPGWCLE